MLRQLLSIWYDIGMKHRNGSKGSGGSIMETRFLKKDCVEESRARRTYQGLPVGSPSFSDKLSIEYVFVHPAEGLLHPG